jgi:hypothetical protein
MESTLRPAEKKLGKPLILEALSVSSTTGNTSFSYPEDANYPNEV